MKITILQVPGSSYMNIHHATLMMTKVVVFFFGERQ